MAVTPRVPIQTPMFDDEGNLTRTWIIFFERLGMVQESAGGAVGPYHRTLLLKDTTVSDDIAARLVGVLRVAIESDLTVRCNLNGDELITLMIPAATAIDTPVESTTFEGETALEDGDVISWDVTASDDSMDGAGVASFTLEWA